MLAILNGAPTWFVVLYVVIGMVIAFGIGLAVAGQIRLRGMLRRGEITPQELSARRKARSRRPAAASPPHAAADPTVEPHRRHG